MRRFIFVVLILNLVGSISNLKAQPLDSKSNFSKINSNATSNNILTSKNIQNKKVDTMKKSAKKDKEDLYKKYLYYATIYIAHEDLDSALESIKQAEKYKTKDDPDFYDLRGSVYEGLGEKDKAFKDYYKAMIMYYNEGKYYKALEEVNSLEAIKFGDPTLEKWEKKIKLKIYQLRKNRNFK